MFPPPHNINYNHHESEDHDQCDVPGTQQVLNKDKWEEKWEELLTSMHCFTTLCQQHERAHALNMVPSWFLSSLTTCNMHSHWPPPSGSILFLPCFHHMASSWVFPPCLLWTMSPSFMSPRCQYFTGFCSQYSSQAPQTLLRTPHLSLALIIAHMLMTSNPRPLMSF